MNRKPSHLSVSCRNRWQHYRATHTHIHHPPFSQSGTVHKCVLVRVCRRCSFRWSDTEEIGCRTGLHYTEAQDCRSAMFSVFSCPFFLFCLTFEQWNRLTEKEESNGLSKNVKESTLVNHFMGWRMPCVNCDCSERWGYWTWRGVGDACQNISGFLSLRFWSTGGEEVLMCS